MQVLGVYDVLGMRDDGARLVITVFYMIRYVYCSCCEIDERREQNRQSVLCFRI